MTAAAMGTAAVADGGELLLRAFAADLRDACAAARDEAATLDAVADLVAQLAACSPLWLQAAMCQPDPVQGFGFHLLAEDADHERAVFVASWLPGRGTPPHDHGTWAVVAGLRGEERNVYWTRLDDGTRPGHARLRRTGEEVVGAGDLVALPAGAIHSVHNESAAITVSLHVYGRHVNHTERSQFDPAKASCRPYKLRTTA